MDEETKRKMIVEYFKPNKTRWESYAFVVGVIIFIISLIAGWWRMIFVGIVLIGISTPYIHNIFLATERNIVETLKLVIADVWKGSSKGKPTDEQMDEWLDEDLKTLEKKAIDKMGTDESELVAESVQITGPRFWGIGGAKIQYKKGNDNIIRFSPLGITVINFAQNQLLAYSCVYDFTTGKALNESTDEYFYKDVVSVTTKTESRSVTWGSGTSATTLQLDAAETFALTTSGGTSISVLLSDPKLIETMTGKKGGEIPTTRAEKAIQTIRKMLREKKA